MKKVLSKWKDISYLLIERLKPLYIYTIVRIKKKFDLIYTMTWMNLKSNISGELRTDTK